MYGSQFHFEQTLAVKSFTTPTLKLSNNEMIEIKKSKWMKLLLIVLGVTISTGVMASPSEPKTINEKILSNYSR